MYFFVITIKVITKNTLIHHLNILTADSNISRFNLIVVFTGILGNMSTSNLGATGVAMRAFMRLYTSQGIQKGNIANVILSGFFGVPPPPPGGCVGGGGQPFPPSDMYVLDPDLIRMRARALYSIDTGKTLRKSHENPAIERLYGDFLGAPGSHLCHELLHTSYEPRHPRGAKSNYIRGTK